MLSHQERRVVRTKGDDARPKVEAAARLAWLADLADLLAHAEQKFGDVCWQSVDGTKIWAHKAIVYARSTAPFQSQYLGSCHIAVNRASPSSAGFSECSNGLVAVAPEVAASGSFRARTASVSIPASTTEGKAASSTSTLVATEHLLLRPALEVMYTGQGMKDVFQFLFESGSLVPSEEEAFNKLREDMLFIWRSELYADVRIKIMEDDVVLLPPASSRDEYHEKDGSPLHASHRAVLAARSPYFAALLQGYSDSTAHLLNLPSSVFSPASLHFLLGAIYCGTLDFSSRQLDLSTVCDIIRGAQYLEIDSIQAEAEERVTYLCHGWRGCCRTCAKRSAYALSFSQRSDLDRVASRIRDHSLPVVVKLWHEAWAQQEVAKLPAALRNRLVADVTDSVSTQSAVSMLAQAVSLRNRIYDAAGHWKNEIVEMLTVVEARIRGLIASELASVIASPSFIELLDGQFFTLSREVLSKMLDNLITDLTEQRMPAAYQILTESVLLRQEGLPVDARILVEDSRQAIVKLLKQRWNSIRANKGFETLECWALKEIADGERSGSSSEESRAQARAALAISPDELLNEAAEPVMMTRTGLKIATKRSSTDLQPLRSSGPDETEPRSVIAALSTSSLRSRPMSSAAEATKLDRALNATAAREGDQGPATTSVSVAPRRSALQPAVPNRTSSSRSQTPKTTPSMQPLRSSTESKREPSARIPAQVIPPGNRVVRKASETVKSKALARADRTESIRTAVPHNGSPPNTNGAPVDLKSFATARRTSKASTVLNARPKSLRSALTLSEQPGRESLNVLASPPRRSAPLPSKVARSLQNAAAPRQLTGDVRTTVPSEAPQTSPPAVRKNLAPARAAHTNSKATQEDHVPRETVSEPRTSSRNLYKPAFTPAGPLWQSSNGSGTALRVPLPALVSFHDGIKARATVHFLGQTHLGPGDLVGVCVEETGLPEKAKKSTDIEWCDGTMDDKAYFAGPHGRCTFVQPDQVLFLF